MEHKRQANARRRDVRRGQHGAPPPSHGHSSVFNDENLSHDYGGLGAEERAEIEADPDADNGSVDNTGRSSSFLLCDQIHRSILYIGFPITPQNGHYNSNRVRIYLSCPETFELT